MLDRRAETGDGRARGGGGEMVGVRGVVVVVVVAAGVLGNTLKENKPPSECYKI